jgi:hypothetical protein
VWGEAKVVNNGCLLHLMPCPQKVTLVNGQHAFKQEVNIYIEGMSDKRQQSALTRFKAQLSQLENFDFTHFNIVEIKEEADIVIIVQAKMVSQRQPALNLNFPSLGDDESYQLTINQAVISIQTNSDFGMR